MRRIGQVGRKAVVDEWSAYLPSYVDPAHSLMSETHDDHSEHDTDHILEGKILGLKVYFLLLDFLYLIIYFLHYADVGYY